jgi:hypothetical protein
MVQKKLCVGSRYNKYDADWNGTVDDDEIDNAQEMLELELREEKADAHRRMAWAAMISMIIFTIALFLPWVSESRVAALADLLGLFYIAQAGVVGAYMGVTAWMSKGPSSTPSIGRFQAAPAPKKIPERIEPEL